MVRSKHQIQGVQLTSYKTQKCFKVQNQYSGKLQILSILMSFLFACCKSVESKEGYQVRRKHQKDQKIPFTNSIQEIPKLLSKNDLNNENFQVLKYEKSEYDDLTNVFKGKKQKWVDPTFPPNQHSLGAIPGIKSNNTWKRISDLLNKPTLFEGPIEPRDVIQGSLDDCYFLSALAAIAERQQYIKAVFEGQIFNPNGIYKAMLRVDGEIKQIIVDDFIPVTNKGQPLFCQPNKSEIWPLILQKAWAKAHQSYANIVAGTPCEIFKAVTYAPTESYSIKSSQEENDKVWKIILANVKKRYISCCSTKQEEEEDWESIGLQQGQTYTLMNAAELISSNGKTYKVMELRNPWGVVDWNGKASEKDKKFWDSIRQSEQKQDFLKKFKVGHNGVFFMRYKDFCKYFTQVHFCLVQENANYISERVFSNKKNGSLYSLNIQKVGNYVFELHQSNQRVGGLTGQLQQQIYRSTLLVVRIVEQKIQESIKVTYQFVDGVLRYNDHDTTLKVKLNPGKYLVYVKLDASPKTNKIADKIVVSVYSTNFVNFEPSSQILHPDMLKKMFLNHARFNKRQTYNNDLMWIAWKLLYQQGGYAYLAFGNHEDSNKKFVISFDQEQFDKLHFKLKKKFKGKGNGQVFEVLPGQQQIILCRVKNLTFKGLKFPPRISIKLEYMNPDEKSVQY